DFALALYAGSQQKIAFARDEVFDPGPPAFDQQRRGHPVARGSAAKDEALHDMIVIAVPVAHSRCLLSAILQHVSHAACIKTDRPGSRSARAEGSAHQMRALRLVRALRT